MLKQRVITAIVLASVFAGTILFADHKWVVVLISVMMFAACYEILALTLKPDLWAGVIGAIMYAILFWVFNESIDPRVNYYQSLVGVFGWILISGFLFFYRFSGEWSLSARLSQLVLALSLIWICGHGLVFIHQHSQQGGWIMLYLMTLVWVADIGAYFSGRKFGKHKLAPGISPGKTWEGVAGGVILNVLWMLIVFQIVDGWGMKLWQFILIGLATSLISVVGDLYESILKREAGVKDSGKLLPGHGGVLDRIDSIIAATPVFLSGLYAAGIA
jgi:phosphatidate cytidylyltransferase